MIVTSMTHQGFAEFQEKPMEPQTVSNGSAGDHDKRLAQLRRALIEGWQIETPVYFRAQWYTGHQKRDGFYFILKRNKEVDLIVIPDSETMRQFIKEQRLKVVAA